MLVKAGTFQDHLRQRRSSVDENPTFLVKNAENEIFQCDYFMLKFGAVFGSRRLKFGDQIFHQFFSNPRLGGVDPRLRGGYPLRGFPLKGITGTESNPIFALKIF